MTTFGLKWTATGVWLDKLGQGWVRVRGSVVDKVAGEVRARARDRVRAGARVYMAI